MSSSLPESGTPLYNHTLPELEAWLRTHQCQRDPEQLHLWRFHHPAWSAEIRLEIEELSILYQVAEDQSPSVHRTFKYSLSRQDVEDAVFAGP